MLNFTASIRDISLMFSVNQRLRLPVIFSQGQTVIGWTCKLLFLLETAIGTLDWK